MIYVFPFLCPDPARTKPRKEKMLLEYNFSPKLKEQLAKGEFNPPKVLAGLSLADIN